VGLGHVYETMIGDELLPPEKRFTKTNIHNYTPHTPLLPSGLLGPVRMFASKP
jgi:hypothetical protein